MNMKLVLYVDDVVIYVDVSGSVCTISCSLCTHKWLHISGSLCRRKWFSMQTVATINHDGYGDSKKEIKTNEKKEMESPP